MSYGRHAGPARADCRRAAVLVLLCWDGNEWLVPLTERQQGLGIHSGQICFAGGGIDAGESSHEAALRECHEELGWSPPQQDVMGSLSPLYVYASNNHVDCILAATTQIPQWEPNPQEVAQLIQLPLKHLCLDHERHETQIVRHGVATRAPCFRWQHHEIWGATSMILAELKTLILTCPPEGLASP